MSVRTYLVIGVIIGVIVFLISTFAGEDIVKWLEEQQFEAAIRSQTLVEKAVYEPLIFAVEQRPWGQIVVALAWPAVFLWLIFLLMALVIVPGVDVARDIDAQTRLWFMWM